MERSNVKVIALGQCTEVVGKSVESWDYYIVKKVTYLCVCEDIFLSVNER